MKTHYYLGWFNNFFPANLEKALQEDIIERKSLVMISSMPASDEIDGSAERSWLTHAGIKFEEYHLINYRVEKEDAQPLIQNASAIFLLGGDTVEQNGFLMEYGLADSIRKSDAIVIGASAGAINMSAKWLCSRNFGYEVEESTLYEGVGLGNFSVLSHFDLENNIEMVRSELSLLSEEMDNYASNKDCALRVREGHIDIVGDVYLISRSEIQKLDETI
ncbi:Type 1 glutamine amidotransferase-like domain-containing protein [Planomicrobium sp. Y74]|uniref:Type 1 glutamine amidotransferase-like domain-containing protein n=1 Tax=Planomicrobium sp. Y74 TaxID=2478977 RepID=UPI0018F55058|nr:Type 1 glutamine amidotransferase-like domain-containing protein [Planomicrobium sp. Y74]